MSEKQSILYFDAGDPGVVGSSHGRLIEFPDSASPDQLGLRYHQYGKLLLAEEAKFPFKPGDFDVLKPSDEEVTRESCIEMGKTTVHALTIEAGTPVALSRLILRRMYILGLGIDVQRYTGSGLFTTISDFRKAVGSPIGDTRNRFKRWNQWQWTQLAIKVEKLAGDRPTGDDYQAFSEQYPEYPSLRVIDQYAGGVGLLNELRGYPAIFRWKKEDFIEFGVHFIDKNGVEKFLVDSFDILSQRKRGPGVTTVCMHFETWNKYKQWVLAEYAEKQQKISKYRMQVASGEAPAGWTIYDDEQLLLRGARMEVVNRLAQGMHMYEKDEVSNVDAYNEFAPMLVKFAARFEAGDFEEIDVVAVARTLSLDKILWPKKPCYIDHIIVTDEELADVVEQSRLAERERLQRKAIELALANS